MSDQDIGLANYADADEMMDWAWEHATELAELAELDHKPCFDGAESQHVGFGHVNQCCESEGVATKVSRCQIAY